MMTRRTLAATAAAGLLSACTGLRPDGVARSDQPAPEPVFPPLPSRYGALPDEPYPVPAVPERVVPPNLWRQEVANPFPDRPPGMIVVDPDGGYLHLVEAGGRALRYGVGVGAAGFAWNGNARLRYRQKWPRRKGPRHDDRAPARVRTLFRRQWRDGPRPGQPAWRAGAVPVPEGSGYLVPHPRGLRAGNPWQGRLLGLHPAPGSGHHRPA